MGKSILAFVLIFSINSIAQELYMPLNMKAAYDKETRDRGGLPGKNYWQNKSDYIIKASIEPETRKLTGVETIIYYNNSPDTLKKLVFRLYQNINKKGISRAFSLPDEALTDGVVIENLNIGGTDIALRENDKVDITGTNLNVELDNPVLPHSQVDINCAWHFTIPKGENIRMGTYDSVSFMVAYWYPQVAVYDDIDRWDMIQYSGRVEFYNDFNNYDVEMTLPNNIFLWSTGVLQNPEEVYTPSIYGKYLSAQSSESVVHVITPEDLNKENYVKTNSSQTWRVKAENVTDFAFAVSGDYLWDAVSLNVPNSYDNRKMLISAVYKEGSAHFDEVASISKQTISMLSSQLPGVAYPFPRETVFNGDGGMEFPMMVNEGTSDERQVLVYVTSHEITHSYFPFYMGINERKYAWMDEGFAQMLPEYIQNTIAPDYDRIARDAFRYSEGAGKDFDVPPMVPSDELKAGYGIESYFRPCFAYNTLKDMLGEEQFGKALREYMKRWNSKHPIPYDFFYTFNDVTKMNLNWFWKKWFFEYAYPDLAIKDVKMKNDETEITIENKGGLPLNINLLIKLSNGEEAIINRTAMEWEKSNNVKIIIDDKNIKDIILGNKHIPDVNSADNVWER